MELEQHNQRSDLSPIRVLEIDMSLVFFVGVFSLLFTAVSPIRDVPLRSSCSSKLHEEHQHVNSSGFHFILHHPRSPCSPAPLPPLSFSEILEHDESRVRHLTSRIFGKASSAGWSHSLDVKPESVTVPLNPGTSFGVGNYVTRIGLGTPATSYAMVVDTGSSLTWLQCSPCRISCHAQVGPIFQPTASYTYHTVPCSAPECGGLQSATLNPSSCSVSNVCIYTASYGDSSFSVGYLSRDILTFGSSGQTFPGFVYGCGQDNEGLFGRSAGLIGLAKNKLSLLSQVAPKFGNAFTYCLPTTSGSGFLSIGSYDPSPYSFTPLLSNSLDSTLYFVHLVTIKVGGAPVRVSASAYTGTPTIIDSGTVITRLPSDVYDAFSSAISSALAKKYGSAPAYSILDTCFKGSVSGIALPEVSLVFQGGAEIKLPAKNVLIDVDSSTTCLAFARAGSVGIIGNHQHQTFKVVYDVASSKLGFAAGGCG